VAAAAAVVTAAAAAYSSAASTMGQKHADQVAIVQLNPVYFSPKLRQAQLQLLDGLVACQVLHSISCLTLCKQSNAPHGMLMSANDLCMDCC
jgi:hypothetical protein